MAAVKLIPLLICWTGMVTVIARSLFARRTTLVTSCVVGFIAGVAAGTLLLTSFKGAVPYSVIKTLVGGSFLVLWGGALAAIYRVTGSGVVRVEPRHCSSFAGIGFAAFVAFMAGGLCACRLFPQGGELSLFPVFLLALGGALLAVAAVAAERFVPDFVAVTAEALLAWSVALLLLMSAFSIQLDLFSPLSMKVMKFVHDFVHQFFESMLIPDHMFFRRDAWEYIGYLFSSGVGFWGGLVVWFAPAILILAAIRLQRLPSVAHIRQGAQRRKLLAGFIRARRCRLILPWCTMVILAMAVYQSRFPGVEYWDPKPVGVSVKPSGEIFIPKKGEIDLEDGRLHKYYLKQGGREARFMVLLTPEGQMTVTLDACAICKPDGYGQAEGSVICYYCKTLIPLETVGKPGGCNPVPVPFKSGEEGVSIDAMTILNLWGETVTSTTRVQGGGK